MTLSSKAAKSYSPGNDENGWGYGMDTISNSQALLEACKRLFGWGGGAELCLGGWSTPAVLNQCKA